MLSTERIEHRPLADVVGGAHMDIDLLGGASALADVIGGADLDLDVLGGACLTADVIGGARAESDIMGAAPARTIVLTEPGRAHRESEVGGGQVVVDPMRHEAAEETRAEHVSRA